MVTRDSFISIGARKADQGQDNGKTNTNIYTQRTQIYQIHIVEQRYILYTHDTLPYLGKSNDSLNRRHGGGERARSDIILGRLRTGIYTNMMVRTDHVWSCLILMIKVHSL